MTSRAFGYALEIPSGHRSPKRCVSGIVYVAGAAGYVAMPVLLAPWRRGRPRAAVADTLWPPIRDAAPSSSPSSCRCCCRSSPQSSPRSEIVSLWTIGGMTLLPVVLLSSPLGDAAARGGDPHPRHRDRAAGRLRHRRTAGRARGASAAASENYGTHYRLVAAGGGKGLARDHRPSAAPRRRLRQSAVRLGVLFRGPALDSTRSSRRN